MSRIVITGATGFIGQHLLQDLLPLHHHVRIITRDATKKMRVESSKYEIVTADLTNVESLKHAFNNTDIIVNIAAEVRALDKLATTNITGTKNLITAALENNVSKIIHLSSVGVVGMQYSSSPITVDEQTPCTPVNEYERTKYESEKLLIEAARNNNFKLDILRPTNVFGEYHPFHALLNLIQHIQAKKVIFGTDTAMVNYVYVKDVTGLIIKLIDDKNEKGIVNVGGADHFKTLIETINNCLNTKTPVYPLPSLAVKLATSLNVKKLNAISNNVVYSDSKLKTFYTYPFGLKKGLQNTIDHYKKHNFIP